MDSGAYLSQMGSGRSVQVSDLCMFTTIILGKNISSKLGATEVCRIFLFNYPLNVCYKQHPLSLIKKMRHQRHVCSI